MEQQVPSQFTPFIKDGVHQLVIGNYAGLIADGRAAQWPEDRLREVIAEITGLQGTLVDLPDEVFEQRIAIQRYDGSWQVDTYLWTVNGVSAWTIVLDIDNKL